MNWDSEPHLLGLIHDHLDGTLTPERLAELEAVLRSSAAARDFFWQATELHGLVHEAEKLRWGTEAGAPARDRRRTPGWWRGRALGWAAAAALLVTGWQMWRETRRGGAVVERAGGGTGGFVAELRADQQVEWETGAAVPVSGQALRPGPLALRSGTVELAFFNGAVVAVRGPARLQLLSPERMRLESGRLSADVPDRAIGFVVETPASEVRDLGTRFGVAVGEDGVTEAHVFEGSVDVTPSAQLRQPAMPQRLLAPEGLALDPRARTIAALAARPSAFPLPQRLEEFPVPCGDFEPAQAGWGLDDALPPASFGVWSGDYSQRVGAEHGIRPRQGKGMLHFISGMREGMLPPEAGQAAERWCFVDLRQKPPGWAGRRVTADFSAWFNRRPGPALGACSAKVILAAFGPGARPGPEAWGQRLQHDAPMKALANSEVLLSTDDDAATWEQALTRIALPPQTEMLLLSLRVQNETDAPLLRFEDCYADQAELTIRLGEAMESAPH